MTEKYGKHMPKFLGKSETNAKNYLETHEKLIKIVKKDYKKLKR